MTDKEKTTKIQSKNIPKDGQVIMAIMKEMGITEYEPKTIVQLTEFVYRFATSILEEARMYANHSNRRNLDVEDVRLALQLTCESTFTTPPPREVIVECANIKNYSQLPLVKPHCGLRLPPDRYCLSSCNYTLKSSQKKGKPNFTISGSGGNMKISAKPNVSYAKRANVGQGKQPGGVPKAVTKIAGAGTTVLKPKIQISHTNSANNGMEVDPVGGFKRKREDDEGM